MSFRRPSLRQTFSILLLVGFCVGMAGSRASETAASHAWSLTFENDLFFQSDSYYTNGVQLALWSNSYEPADLIEELIGVVCDKKTSCNSSKFEYGRYKFGQLMYTPQNITVARNQPFDRPWAGMLYLSKDWVYAPSESQRKTFTALVGVVGPASLAEQTQKWVHDTFSGDPPAGWDNQIGGELGLLLGYKVQQSIKGLSAGQGGELQVRTAWSLRGVVGNVMTFAGLGLSTALGKNLRDIPSAGSDMEIKKEKVGLVARSRSTLGAEHTEQPGMSCPFSWLECSLVASLEARIVAHNIFLDGNTFSSDNDIRIDKRLYVVDASVGIRFDFPRTRGHQFLGSGPLYVSFITTWRSPEFTSALGTASKQKFAALTIGRDL